jgi:hypothetical protein
LEEKCGYCRKFLKLKELTASYSGEMTENLDRIFGIINSL